MAVVVKIPTQLRAAAGGEAEAEVDGATVQEVLDGLFERHEELRVRISDDDGSLRRFVNVYLAGEDIRFLDGLATPVARRRGADDPAGRRRRLARRGVLGHGASPGRRGPWRGGVEPLKPIVETSPAAHIAAIVSAAHPARRQPAGCAGSASTS